MHLTSHNAVLKVIAEVKVFRYSCNHIHERIIDQVIMSEMKDYIKTSLKGFSLLMRL